MRGRRCEARSEAPAGATPPHPSPAPFAPHTRVRATGVVVAPPAPSMLLLSHGEDFEERVGIASETTARIDLYVELLCLEAVDRAVVEYFDVSVGWLQQQQKQLEQQQPEQQQQLEQQQPEQQQ